MKQKDFSINAGNCSIRCRLFSNDPRGIELLTIFCHGFGGHKGSRAAERFAQALTAKKKSAALLCFDWPCHGDDGRKRLCLEDCDTYLRLVIQYAQETWTPRVLDCYATSFGGYLTLKYIAEHGCPFNRVALRCPAVNMAESLAENMMSQEEREKLEKGKELLVGFDRKVKIDRGFLRELQAADVRKMDFLPVCEQLLILHGEKDEIIPFAASRDFADNNLIEFVPFPKADHRFQDPRLMDLAINRIVSFFLQDPAQQVK